jgi:hypothetical protein
VPGIEKIKNLPDRSSDRMFPAIERKYNTLESKIPRYYKRSLEKFQKQEQKLHDKDSLEAKRLLAESTQKYTALLQKLKKPVGNNTGGLNHYLPGLDSLQTAFYFPDKAGARNTSIESQNRLPVLKSSINAHQI